MTIGYIIYRLYTLQFFVGQLLIYCNSRRFLTQFLCWACQDIKAHEIKKMLSLPLGVDTVIWQIAESRVPHLRSLWMRLLTWLPLNELILVPVPRLIPGLSLAYPCQIVQLVIVHRLDCYGGSSFRLFFVACVAIALCFLRFYIAGGSAPIKWISAWGIFGFSRRGVSRI